MDAEKIKEALRRLNTDNDEHWTQTGKPSVDAVSELVGENVTRADINAADAEFNRDATGDTGLSDTADPDLSAAAADPDADRLSGEFDPRNDPGPALKGLGLRELPASGGTRVERNQNAIFDRPSPEMEGDKTRPNAEADIGSGPGGAARNLALAQRRAAQQGLDDPRIAAARRQAAEATLGKDDERVGAVSAERPDVISKRARIMNREERLRGGDLARHMRRKTYAENSRIAAEEGAPNAPDWVDGEDIITLDRRYYNGKIYEANEKIIGFLGRMPFRAIKVSEQRA